MNFFISRQLLTSYIITNELNSCLHCGTSTEFYVETCSWQSAIGTIPSTVTTIQWRPNSSGARYHALLCNREGRQSQVRNIYGATSEE